MREQHQHFLRQKYRRDIDGLRAIAVLGVVGFHFLPNLLSGGFIGVDIFLVISGYLISTKIFEGLEKRDFRFSEFYSRRVRRIFPALLSVLIATFILGWFTLLADEFKQLGKHISAGSSFVSNLVLWREAGYFDNSAETKPLLHLWSLAIEEQFYIAWPIFLWCAWKCRINFVAATLFIAIGSFFLNVYGVAPDPVGTFYSLQTRFWELLSGSLLAWYGLNKKNEFLIFGQKFNGFCSIAGLALLFYGFYEIEKSFRFPGLWALIPIVGTVLLLLGGPKSLVNQKILANPVLVWFGLISFPLYLWHWPLFSFARIIGGETPSTVLSIVLLSLSIAFAWLTFIFLERPFRFGNLERGKSVAVTVVLVLSMIIVGSIGYTTYKLHGLQNRFINQLNEGVNKALIYDADLDYRRGKCFIDDVDDATSKFSSICSDRGNGKSSILIWGDSHSASLYKGFVSQSTTKKYDVFQFSASGCPPILDFHVEKREGCISSNRYVYKEIERLMPDTIILSAFWSMYDGTNGWEALDVNGLAETLSQLKALGVKNIILIGHLPTFTVKQPELLRRHSIFDKVVTKSSAKLRPNIYFFDSWIKQIALASGVDFISPLDTLCDVNGCLLSVPGATIDPISFDYGHLTANGSDYIISRFFELNLIKISNN